MGDFLRCKNCKHDKGKCVGSSRKGGHKNCFEPKIATNADRIRTMSDEELADWLNSFGGELFCLDKKECVDLVNADQDIPAERCRQCALAWLRQPAEE